jgi:hypothetical protein
MNVEIGAEAAQFPEKEYINGIAVAVQWHILKNDSGDTGSLLVEDFFKHNPNYF